jgi:hypothetical protein
MIVRKIRLLFPALLVTFVLALSLSPRATTYSQETNTRRLWTITSMVTTRSSGWRSSRGRIERLE